MNHVTTFITGKQTGADNTGSTLETMVKGDLLLINYDTLAVLSGAGNTIANAPVIAIAYCKEDGVPLISNPIYGKSLTGGGSTAYAAPAYAKKGFGYTSASTTATLPAVGSTEIEWSGALVFPTDLRLRPNKQSRLEFNVYSKGGYDLALKLKSDINRMSDVNPRLDGNKLVVANISSNLTTVIGAVGVTYAVTKGTKTVTFSAAHGLVQGSYVKLADGYTYRVASLGTGNVLYLDSAYLGATVTAATSNLSFKSADGVTEPSLIGIEIVANPIVINNPVDKYDQVDFTIGLSKAFGSLAEVVITAFGLGAGTGQQIRDFEISCMGWDGYTDRRDPMRQAYSFQSNLSLPYNTVSVSSKLPVTDYGNPVDAPVSVLLAFYNTVATQRTTFMGILTPWLASGGVTAA